VYPIDNPRNDFSRSHDPRRDRVWNRSKSNGLICVLYLDRCEITDELGRSLEISAGREPLITDLLLRIPCDKSDIEVFYHSRISPDDTDNVDEMAVRRVEKAIKEYLNQF